MNIIVKDQKSRIIMGVVAAVISCAAVFAAFFASEINIGTNILLRFFLSISCTLAASAFCFGLLKFSRLFPLRISSTFFGAGIIVTWCIYDIVTAFPILPFSTSWPLTIGVSVLRAGREKLDSDISGKAALN